MLVDSCEVICFEFSNSLSAITANIGIDNHPSRTSEGKKFALVWLAVLSISERWYELVVNGLI